MALWQRGAPARRAPVALLPLLLLLGAALPVALEAKVTYTHVYRDDRSLIQIAPNFAFADSGRLDIVITDISLWQRHEQDRDVVYDNLGVFLAPVEEAGADEGLSAQLATGNCLLSDREAKLFTFAKPQYALYFANCDGAAVSFRAVVSMYNLRPDGSRDYLAVGETELGAVYWTMFGLFLALTAAWTAVLVLRRECAHRIHLLMGALVLFKTLTLMAQALMTLHVERTGLADGWNYAYYVFTTARGLLFFSVVVLIGAGWSYMKPFMDDRTRTTLLVVVPLQVLANIALVYLDEESPAMRDWIAWRDVFHLVDIACCAAILFPILWQMKHLREAATVDGKAARSLAKLRLFRTFYVTVVAYIYFTRIVVYLLKNFVEYRYSWTTEAVNEVAALAFYTWVGASFRPAKENRYLQLSQEDIELATAY
ncbi:hypothetical protein MNEG_4587 [Monoraphidium neglectum]|uniref:GOST seven transmembrane domain-containing protein n=1 Tax=Monoraphidium neglectum TaxID=145388 RepID=A0A0D2MSH6_9CHLO|nr:hypothetical protein MNEG_4587 [Monoraphidium neglectum]KIZ03372.1 hypothetical protein MNEG_4587 [Monoraphidium neglectum]|eukprot:XP_013902391.1 hypothetical protein MNEG_4587 [Monoraphidium neglectum]